MALLHGAWLSLEIWDEWGYVDALRQEYRLILLDARGEGASDKPHDPEAYRVELRVADVIAVLDDLNIERAHVYGYSLGGWIGFGLAKYAPERVHSLIVGGMHPILRRTERTLQMLREVRKEGMKAIVPFFGEEGWRRLGPEAQARVVASDVEALIARAKAARSEPGTEDVLPTMTMPSLIYLGEKDGAMFPGAGAWIRRIPQATFVSLPGLSHAEAFYRSDLVLPHVLRFLKTITTDSR